MRVSEETSRVSNDLADVEAVSVVLGRSSGGVGADEEGSLQAAVRGTALIGSGRVGEGLEQLAT